MSKTHALAERRTAGGGKSARSAETGTAGGGDLIVESTLSGPAATAAGGNGAPLPIVHDLGMFQGVAGGTAASAASAAPAGQAGVAGGDAPAATPSATPSASAVAGGDAAMGAEAPVARAGGDTALGRDLPAFHVFGPRDHVMTEAAVPGLGDVGNNPNYIQRGSTAHFVVFYDSALGNAGASAADAVLGKCEADFNTLRGWFSNTTPGSLPFNVYITTASNGASHASCSSTTLYLGANSSNPINNSFVLQLLIAEEDEVFEAAFGHGWNCGASNGEGLSRVLANDLYPGAEPSNFVSSASWLDAPGRPDWINNTEGTDQHYVSIGCSVLFLNWMRFQLGYSWTQIIAAGDF